MPGDDRGVKCPDANRPIFVHYFKSEPNYILFTLWLKTLIEYLLIISQYRDFERITTAALDKRNL